jgi:hypothetical protein
VGSCFICEIISLRKTDGLQRRITMTRHNLLPPDDDLRKRMRREAMASRPAFSEPLHQRIVAALQQASLPAADAADRTHRVGLTRRTTKYAALAFVSAALTAACVLFAIFYRGQPNEPSPIATPAVANAELIMLAPLDDWTDATVDVLSGLTVSEAITPHSKAIESDTRLVAETLLRRLPIDVELGGSPQ